MTAITRKYRERGKQAAEDFERGYHYAQNSPLLWSLLWNELNLLGKIYRSYCTPRAYGIAKACEDKAQKLVTV
jgi:hypothetical protein